MEITYANLFRFLDKSYFRRTLHKIKLLYQQKWTFRWQKRRSTDRSNPLGCRPVSLLIQLLCLIPVHDTGQGTAWAVNTQWTQSSTPSQNFTKIYSAFHLSGVGKWVPAIAGKAGMAHSDCGLTCGCAGKTVRSLENTCHTGALLRWWFTMKRCYIKCMYLYLLPLPICYVWSCSTYTQA